MTSALEIALMREAPADPPRATLEGQRLRLREIVAAYAVEHRFAHGDLVAEKPGLSNFTADVRDRIALVFWRYLDLSEPRDVAFVNNLVGSSISADTDCLAMFIDDGASLTMAPRDSRTLRPLDAAEAAELARCAPDRASSAKWAMSRLNAAKAMRRRTGESDAAFAQRKLAQLAEFDRSVASASGEPT